MKRETVRASQLNGCAFCMNMHVEEVPHHSECPLPMTTRAQPECPRKDAAGFTDPPHGDRASQPRDGRV
ncbi:alkylhydroperoxidase family enzyme [Bradyrhizobium yuanmingense]|uniref:Alkylhydroperoxidase family enzyme n=1 Tax=Bradyrhizobium yuanmingense TaxID=108015 RepID=A0ABV4GN78_9BRAD